MKKIISILTLLLLITIFCFTGNVYADPLGTVDVTITKELVRPGEEVKVNIEFGTALGSYTFDVAYDNNIFEYVSSEGGTENNMGDKVRVVFFDSSGGMNPRTNMSVTFKAKEDITTSNPTEFSITAEGLSNSDASVTFDDITIPIVKNVTVEPVYIDYTLNLEAEEEIIAGKETKMKLSYSSPMGHYYDKARLIAEASTQTGGTVNLIGKDQSSLDHDIIQNGWGDAQGYKIGGKDFSQVLNLTGKFSEPGEYSITLKLIDRENSDNVIAEETFKFTAKEQEEITPTPEDTTPEETTPETPEEEPSQENIEEKPNELPKTGINMYVPIILAIILLAVVIFMNYNKKVNVPNTGVDAFSSTIFGILLVAIGNIVLCKRKLGF